MTCKVKHFLEINSVINFYENILQNNKKYIENILRNVIIMA